MSGNFLTDFFIGLTECSALRKVALVERGLYSAFRC